MVPMFLVWVAGCMVLPMHELGSPGEEIEGFKLILFFIFIFWGTGSRSVSQNGV